VTRDRRRASALRRLLPFLLVRRRLIFGGLAAAAVVQALQLTVPRLLAGAVDGAIVRRDRPVAPIALTLVAVAVVQLVVGRWFRLSVARGAALIEGDLRMAVHRAFLQQSAAFHDRASTGDLLSRGNADVKAVAGILAWAPLFAIILIGSGVALVLTALIAPALAAVSLLPLAAVVGVSVRGSRALEPVTSDVQQRTGAFSGVAAETIGGRDTVRALGAEAQRDALADDAIAELRRAAGEEIAVRRWFQPAVQHLPRLTLVAMLLLGGPLVIDGHISFGELVAATTYLAILQGAFRFASFLLLIAQRSEAGAARVCEVLEEPVAVADPDRPGTLPSGPLGIELRGVSFGYGGPDVVHECTVTLQPGELVALVGTSGSGKSTLLRLAARRYDPRAGTVVVGGVDVRDLPRAVLGAAVSLVGDDAFLFTSSLRDNVAFTRPDASDDDVRHALAVAAADTLPELLPDGLDTVVGERGTSLSGGQRQRVALARAVLHQPRVLLLDDVTSSLDVETERRVLDGVRAALPGTTMLMAAHRIPAIALADRVVFLDGHRVVTGRHHELVRDEAAYRSLLAAVHAQEAEAVTTDQVVAT
jgi:ATP-binding cassette subfamily B protein